MYIENISAAQLKEFVFDDRYKIIELREFSKYQREHVINAIHVSTEDITNGRMGHIRQRRVILYCDRGGESIRMARILAEDGYLVKNVIGGYREIKKIREIIE